MGHHQGPADVRVEESSVRVVRVRVRVRVLVVQPVVAHPVVNAVLDAHRLEQGQNDAQRQLGLVRVMRPQPVRAGRHADRRHGSDRERCNIRKTDRKVNIGSKRLLVWQILVRLKTYIVIVLG